MTFQPYNKLYTKEICQDIFKRAKEEFARAKAWHPDSEGSLNAYTIHFCKGIALTELLESIIGFNIGDGAYNFKRPTPKGYNRHLPEHRLTSFEDMLK